MITGRSALTERCREVLRFIDDDGSVDEHTLQSRLGLHRQQFRKHVGLLEERGFVTRANGVIYSLSSPGVQA